MSVTKWAEREIEAACKRENPNWDGKSFDYGCSCYLSALKAFKSLMEDDHSGYSYSITKNILKKLLDRIPLSSITDEDFFSVKHGTEEFPASSDEWLKEQGLKSELQCPRRSSLFRREDLEGNITYHDINRAYCCNAENTSDTYSSSSSNFIDELYPITMPYMPSNKQFVVYERTWLTDKSHGDFDVKEILGYTDLEGNWHDYHQVKCETDNGWTVITDESKIQEIKDKRIDKFETKIAYSLYNDIIDLFATDELWCKEDKTEYNAVKQICTNILEDNFEKLTELCKCLTGFDSRGICQINNWHNQHIIVNGSEDERKSLCESYKQGEKYTATALIKFVDNLKVIIKTELDIKNFK